MKTKHKNFDVVRWTPMDEITKLGELYKAQAAKASINNIIGEVLYRQGRLVNVGRRALVESVIFKLNEDIRQAERIADNIIDAS